MHKALHPRDDVDRQYVSRKEDGRGVASIEDSVDTSIRKEKRKTNNSNQKQHKQHKNQQNNN